MEQLSWRILQEAILKKMDTQWTTLEDLQWQTIREAHKHCLFKWPVKKTQRLVKDDKLSASWEATQHICTKSIFLDFFKKKKAQQVYTVETGVQEAKSDWAHEDSC